MSAETATRPASRSNWDPWEDIEKLTHWLNESNGCDDHEISMRIMKISEEMGEVVAAYIGMTGQNPRKGVTHTRNDVLLELCDVIVTAMVAVETLTGDPVVSRGVLAGKFAHLLARADAATQERAS